MTTIILFGGRSDERHVSVASAQNIVRALSTPRDRETAKPRDPILAWFWAPNGSVYDVQCDDLLAHPRPFTNDFHPSRPAIWPDLEMALDTLPVVDPVFLLALHGGEGEDGTVQRMMEERGIPFTGSGSESSAAAFDKGRAKEIVEGHVRLAESRVVADVRLIDRTVAEMLEQCDKIVLKPLAGGSSRGLFFLERGEETPAVENVSYIVEQFIAGRELTVGVVDGGDGPIALPVLEIETDPGLSFDYEGKYLGKGTREICPARISEVTRDEAQIAALAAHAALRCDGYSRTDLVAADDGIYFIELNTLPGLTTASLLPQELREGGIEFREFLEQQIVLAKSLRSK
ncbi:MAG TPA: ATP-grasp domain-containing protein [Thermoanaerobaculia bacterium]|jgi:D-alanine-D-alanine ligase|nr:ATP-grasp domain-containing protein [Thermoanaerobaculia bacterium]